MSSAQKESEALIQRNIVRAIGALPGVLVFRNSVGVVEHEDPITGKKWKFPYGLGKGTPDLIVFEYGHARGLEVKTPGENATKEQREVHEQWRSQGTFACVVRSAEDAFAALERARNGELE